MIRCIFAILLLIGCFVSCAQSGETDELLNRGEEAFRQGDYIGAYNLILPLAESGDPEAQFALATILSFGAMPEWFVDSDEARESQALHWLRQSASQGFPNATNLMSDAYRHGWYGLSIDMRISECWKESVNNPSAASRCVTLDK